MTPEKPENEFSPDWTLPPGEILLAALEERNISVAAFANTMQIDIARLQRLISGCDAVDEKTAIALDLHLGIPAAFWLRAELLFRTHLWVLWQKTEGNQ